MSDGSAAQMRLLYIANVTSLLNFSGNTAICQSNAITTQSVRLIHRYFLQEKTGGTFNTVRTFTDYFDGPGASYIYGEYNCVSGRTYRGYIKVQVMLYGGAIPETVTLYTDEYVCP